MRTIMITGAGSGLGRSVALTLAAQGHTVYAGCQIPPQITDLLNQLEGVGEGSDIASRLHPFRLDLTRPNDLVGAAVLASEKRIDTLFNNAGIIEAGKLIGMPLSVVREVFEVNVFGTLNLVQLVVKEAFHRPARAGRVVFMSSVSGIVPVRYVGAYAASKHAIEAIAGTLAIEEPTLQVSVVNPVLIDTGFDARAFEAAGLVEHIRPLDAVDPAGTVAEIVAAVLGETGAYRNVIPDDHRAEILGRQTQVWSAHVWSA